MMMRKSKPVLADFITVGLFSKDNAFLVGMVLMTSYINSEELYHTISFNMAYFF